MYDYCLQIVVFNLEYSFFFTVKTVENLDSRKVFSFNKLNAE